MFLQNLLNPNYRRRELEVPSRLYASSFSFVAMTSDVSKSGRKRREIRAKKLKTSSLPGKLASDEDDSSNLVSDNKKGPKRGREVGSDADEPLIKKAAVEADKPTTHLVKTSDSYLSKTKFDQFPLSPLSLKAIQDAGFKTMTVVQEATLPLILKGETFSFFQSRYSCL